MDKRADLLEKIHLKLNGYISKKQMAALKAIHNSESVFDNLLQIDSDVIEIQFSKGTKKLSVAMCLDMRLLERE